MGLRIFGFIFSAVFSLGSGLIGFTLVKPYLKIPGLKYPLGLYPFPYFEVVSYILFVSLGMLVGFLIGSILFRRMVSIGQNLKRIPAEDKIACTLGTLIALIFSGLTASFVNRVPVDMLVKVSLIMLASTLIIWGFNLLFLSMKEELKYLIPGFALRAASNASSANQASSVGATAKLLDTNIIIDGRIYDICCSGFIEGSIILPGFVLEELQHIADSADSLRRNRGRRGLDILNQMQKEPDITVKVMDRYKATFAPSDGVDIKLVKLAKSMGNADIVTNDYNLNKVARLHGVRVLNINELANAVKPIVLPGEELQITVIREGKEYNQGVGYLDDGTMVVVENGKKMLGESVIVAVSSVLQTVAGKMIFAELKYENVPEENDENSSYYAGRGNRRKTL